MSEREESSEVVVSEDRRGANGLKSQEKLTLLLLCIWRRKWGEKVLKKVLIDFSK